MRRRDPRKRNAKLNLSKGLLHLSEVGRACSLCLCETRHSNVLLLMFIAALDSSWLLTYCFLRKSWLTFSFEQNPDSLLFWEILTLLL
jgi:hypothetical protein